MNSLVNNVTRARLGYRHPRHTGIMFLRRLAKLVALVVSVSTIGVAHGQTPKGKWRPERVKVLVPVPAPGGPSVDIKTLDIPSKPKIPSPTATELLSPIVELVRALRFETLATVEVTNAQAFKRAISFASAPSHLHATATVVTRQSNRRAVDSLSLAVARRAMKALSEYRASPGELTGLVCISAPALFTRGGPEPTDVKVRMPAKELAEFSLQSTSTPREAAITLEYRSGLAYVADRFFVESPLDVEWDRTLMALLRQNEPPPRSRESACVLTIYMSTIEEAYEHRSRLKLARAPSIDDVEAVRVRVGPARDFLLGRVQLVPRYEEE